MAAPVARRCRTLDKSIIPATDSKFSAHQHTHLNAVSNAVIKINASLAAFYRFKMLKEDAISQTSSHTTYKQCAFCGIQFLPDNHRVRLLPRQRFTPRIKRLMQRQEDNPASLGKFQQKLVAQYQRGCNKVAVTCFSCKKTSKYDGQSREQRQKQHEELTTPSTVPEQLPKTRKDKKKEKRKLLKKMKKGRVDEADVNAGLTLGNSCDGASIDSNNRLSSSVADRISKMELLEDRPSPPLSSRKQSGQNRDVKIDISNSSVGTRKDLSLKQAGSAIRTSKHLTHSPLPEKVDKRLGHAAMTASKQSEPITGNVNNPAGPIKSNLKRSGPITGKVKGQGEPIAGKVGKQAGRKNKAKKLSQQLGNILKEEKKKKSGEATLADFLSTL